jgi:ankyrin repeat protein
MAFNCSEHEDDNDRSMESHSVFGDAYSMKSRSTGSSSAPSMRYDEPEADYDDGATDLYRRIENKDWDGALSRLEVNPIEAKTWVSRREHNSEKTRWRLLPLHAVCIFRAPLALIEGLIQVYPDGPKMKDDQGMLPVHLACRNGASKGVVMTLLMAFPESIHVNDRKGRSPNYLVEGSASANKEAVLYSMKMFMRDFDKHGVNVVKFQRSTSNPKADPKTNHRASPKAKKMSIEPLVSPLVQEVDYEHRTVLFRLVMKKDWKAVSERIISHPDEVSTWIVTKGFNGNLRFLPLHKACVLQPPQPIVDALLKAYEQGAASKDQDGWLPIHCACFYGASESVIHTLLLANPKGAQSKDDEGRLPLHYACLKGASEGVVDALLSTFAKGAVSKDEEGRLPIHHACGKGAPEGVIDTLLKASPKGAQSKDDQGRLPLHHACRKNATERVIRTLLRVYPRAAQIKDDQDKLPIHYSCQNGGGESVISLLLSTFPASINVQNGFGYTPLAEAKSQESNNPKIGPVIRLLERAKEDFDSKRSVDDTVSVEKVHVLEQRIAQLENSLQKVVLMGKEMQTNLTVKHKNSEDVLEKFADKLVALGGKSKSSSKSKETVPFKVRQSKSTPIKNLFSRKGQRSVNSSK